MKIVSVLTLLFFAFFPTSFLCWGYTTCSYSMPSFLSPACRQPLSRQYPSPNNCRKEFPRMSVQNLPCNLPIKDATMHLVHGRRCLLIPSRHSQNRNINMNMNTRTTKEDCSSRDTTILSSPLPSPSPSPPPIIILGGMAQCIESLLHHLPEFSIERDVLMYEYCGSGRQGPQIEESHQTDVSAFSYDYKRSKQ